MAYSYKAYTGDGSNDIFQVTMPYIDKTHVSVLVDGVDTTFTWINDATIKLSSVPTNGATIKVKRDTPRDDRLVDFQNGTNFTEAELDKTATQMLYVVQEAYDYLVDGAGFAKDDHTHDWSVLLNAGGETIAEFAAGLDAASNITDMDAATTRGFYSWSGGCTGRPPVSGSYGFVEVREVFGDPDKVLQLAVTNGAFTTPFYHIRVGSSGVWSAWSHVNPSIGTGLAMSSSGVLSHDGTMLAYPTATSRFTLRDLLDVDTNGNLTKTASGNQIQLGVGNLDYDATIEGLRFVRTQLRINIASGVATCAWSVPMRSEFPLGLDDVILGASANMQPIPTDTFVGGNGVCVASSTDYILLDTDTVNSSYFTQRMAALAATKPTFNSTGVDVHNWNFWHLTTAVDGITRDYLAIRLYDSSGSRVYLSQLGDGWLYLDFWAVLPVHPLA